MRPQVKLLEQGKTDRQQWTRDRLVELALYYAIEAIGFAILGNICISCSASIRNWPEAGRLRVLRRCGHVASAHG